MSRTRDVSRRRFLKRVTVAAPSYRITIGVIGTGSHGINRDIKGLCVHLGDCE